MKPLQTYFDTDNIALIIGRKQISYRELYREIQEKIETLRALCPAGSVIAFEITSTFEDIVTLFAIIFSKNIALPINPELPKRVLEKLLGQNEIGLYLGDIKVDKEIDQVSLKGLVRKKRIKSETEILLDPNAVATLVATSGSSSEGKLVAHTLHNHFYSALGSSQIIPLTVDDSWLLSLPLYHISGLAIIFRCLFSQCSVVFANDSSKYWHLSETSFTIASLVPNQLSRALCDSKIIERLKTKKALLVGGAALDDHLLKRALENSLPIKKTYGSTELCSQVTTTLSKDDLDTSGSILPFRQIKFTDEHEILLKGKTLSPGYFKNNNLQPLTDENNWFHSNDCGCLDSNQRLVVKGRLDNMFTSGGFNIFCEEIENVILQFEEIEKCIVVAIANDKFGSRPVAIIQPYSEKLVESLQNKLISELHKYKLPDSYLPWPKEEISLKVNRKYFSKYAVEKLV